jgi:hypothetical protein
LLPNLVVRNDDDAAGCSFTSCDATLERISCIRYACYVLLFGGSLALLAHSRGACRLLALLTRI